MVCVEGLNILYVKKKIKILATCWLNSDLSIEGARGIGYEFSYCCSVSHSVNSGTFLSFCVP